MAIDITDVNIDDTVKEQSVGNVMTGTELDTAVSVTITDIKGNSLAATIQGVPTATTLNFDYGDVIADNQKFGAATIFAVGAPAALFLDDFTGTNGDPLVGRTPDGVGSGTWALDGTGDWDIQGDTLRQFDQVGGEHLCYIDTGVNPAADGPLTYTARHYPNNSGMRWRIQAADRTWYWMLSLYNSTAWLYEVRNGSDFNLRGQASITMNPSTYYDVQVIDDGVNMVCTVDGVAEIQFTSTSWSEQSEIGFRSRPVQALDAHFEYLQVE